MAYKEISSTVVNIDYWAQKNEFSKNRLVLAVSFEYIFEEIGLDDYPELTTDYVNRLESELRIRQQLKSQDIIKAVKTDWQREVINFYIINPSYSAVPVGMSAPEQFIP